MSVLNSITDFFGLTDSSKPQREAERQAATVLQSAERGRVQANEIAQQTIETQRQMTERARLAEAAAAQTSPTPEPEVNLAQPAPATRRRARFQAQTDPSLSIRI